MPNTPDDIEAITWTDLQGIPGMPKAMPLFWATDYGLLQARWLSWAHLNSDWEESWPQHEREQVHKARALLLAMTFIVD